ncbi:MAG TPA: S8 family peptidase [Blastocatellia bacterium]|nr:S8 family peptidase [Blastocatellia bacterium]
MKRNAPLTDGFFLSEAHPAPRLLTNIDWKSAKAAARCLLAIAVVLSCMGLPNRTRGFGSVAQANSQKPLVEQNSPGDETALQAGSTPSKVSLDLQELMDNKPDISGARARSRESGEDASPRMVDVIIQTASKPDKKFLRALSHRGGYLLSDYNNVEAVAAHVPVDQIGEIASQSHVEYISLDRPTQATGHLETTTGANIARNYGNASTGSIDGSGVGIAILDSGVYANHESFSDERVICQRDFTGEGRTDDPYGHGTVVASMAAGGSNGGNYTGIAPGAKIISLRVLNGEGVGRTSDAIAGIDWCISNKAYYNIRVLNLSLGAIAVDSYVNDPLCRAVRRAANAGIVVCVAAGNAGKDSDGNKIYGGIHSPGIEPSAITVGAANTFATDGRSDDVIATYSSRGPTRGFYTTANGVRHYDNLLKPDLVAPGNKILGAMSPNNYLVTTYPALNANNSSNARRKMMYLSGSSVASPVVAGAAALLIERNPNVTPNMVKAFLEYTAQPLRGFNNLEQGAGLLNVEGAVRLTSAVRSNVANLTLGAPLLTGAAPSQLTSIAGQPFVWGGGIIQKWNFVHGNELVTKYQGVYGWGVMLSDGVTLSSGVLLADRTLLTAGALPSSGALLSNGTTLSDGALFMEGVILSDGAMLADGVVLSDGVILSDCVLPPTTGQGALATGDTGGCMTP